MKATPVEKLILVMLSDLHQKAGIKNSVDPSLVSRAILDDDLWVLDWAYSGLNLGIETPQNVRFVVDVLDMFQFLAEGYQALDDEGREQVKDEDPHAESFIKFPGFDGNHEGEYLSIASYLVDDLDRFQSLKAAATKNSHCGMVDTYQRMLSVFLPIRARLAMRGLNAAEIVSVLAERVHPENR